MFRPLALYIGLRYTRTKRRNGFISFISLTSMLSIALGVAVLITVLSVMNGFDSHIREQIFSLSPTGSINGLNGKLANWQAVTKQIRTQQKTILATAPFVQGETLLRFNNVVQSGLVWGILPLAEAHLNALATLMLVGQLTELKAGSFHVVLGAALANNLGLSVGDKVTIMIPRVTVGPAGIMSVFKRFTVVGLFQAGNGFGFDSHFAYINLSDAQKLFGLGQDVSGINWKITDIYQAPALSYQLQRLLPNTYVSDWTEQYGAFFKAVQLEKTIMFLILTLIIATAAFNLVSTLVMGVTEKQADIAILRTLGATPNIITQIFVVQGTLIGLAGTLLGLAGGLLLALNITKIVSLLEALTHTQLFSHTVYLLDYLPSELHLSDVIGVCGTALVLSLLATLYPARKASRIQPAEALRYE